MGKFDSEAFVVRQSFSHARVKPVVVEKVKRRAAPADDTPALRCPSCGARMKLVISKSEGRPNLTASCPQCGRVTIDPKQ